MSVEIGNWGGGQYTTYTNPTTSVNNTFTQGTLPGGSVQTNIRVINNTTGMCFVQWGTTAQTATTASVPFAPGVTEIHNMGVAATNIAVLTLNSGNVYIGIGGGS